MKQNLDRVAKLGNWPAKYNKHSLLGRVPDTDGTLGHGGFDAGVACSLDLIPRDKQRLSAELHAAWTPAAVDQIKAETGNGIDPDSQTAWWLAACNVCDEADSTPERFRKQLDEMRQVSNDPQVRASHAKQAFSEMGNGYTVTDEVPWAQADGGMQGAYVHGYPIAAAAGSGSSEGSYFLGTYHESLGLENFEFDEGSNLVHGSPNFAVFSSREEHARAVAVAQQHLA